MPLAGFDAEASLLSEDPLESSLADPELEASIYHEPQSELRRALYDEPQQDAPYDAPQEAPAASIYEEPESDLRSSLYDEPLEDVEAEEPSTDDASGAFVDEGTEYVEPPAAIGAGTDSSIWMAGAAEEDDRGTGPLTAGANEYGRSVAGTEGVSDLRAVVSGPPGQIRRLAGKVAKTVVVLAVVGAAVAGLFVALFGPSGWGVFALSEGPLGAVIFEALATDIPTETPIPVPTSTRRPAPTLPPVTEEAAVLPTTEGGTPASSSNPECVWWDAISLDDEGSEACVFGVIKRWWAGEDIPFIAIFSEEAGTFAIIDRTTRHPVGPGICIMARGTVEVMGGTRPNIDAQGELETCPADLVEG